MIRDLVFNREPTKPAIGKVHSHITAQRPLRSDRKHAADDEHPDHQHWIDRWPTQPRVLRCQLEKHPAQIKTRAPRDEMNSKMLLTRDSVAPSSPAPVANRI